MSSSLRLHVPSALEYFASLVAEDMSINLLEAAIAIGQDEFPRLDVQSVQAEVDTLARRLLQRLPADAPSAHRLRALNRYFHTELGFAGNVNNYYEAGNSYVHHVLATRRGIPITLAVIYLELASQIGLQARGVAFPGHFLIKLHLSQGEVMLDPFSGRSLSRSELDEALQPYRQSAGLAGDVDLPLELFLQAATPRQVLARMLRNLKEIHRAQSDWDRLLPVQQRLVLLLPDDLNERRDRSLVLEALGHWSAAAADIEFYLDRAEQAPDRVAQQLRLDDLRGRDGPALH